MNIQHINTYNTSFSGIKLSTDNYEKVRDMVTKLKFMGIGCAGHKSFTTNNTVAEKAYLANYMRIYEQKLFKNIQKVDKNAKINLII